MDEFLCAGSIIEMFTFQVERKYLFECMLPAICKKIENEYIPNKYINQTKSEIIDSITKDSLCLMRGTKIYKRKCFPILFCSC